ADGAAGLGRGALVGEALLEILGVLRGLTAARDALVARDVPTVLVRVLGVALAGAFDQGVVLLLFLVLVLAAPVLFVGTVDRDHDRVVVFLVLVLLGRAGRAGAHAGEREEERQRQQQASHRSSWGSVAGSILPQA